MHVVTLRRPARSWAASFAIAAGRQIDTKLHGDNVGLKALLASKSEEYFRQNMRFALLEFWSMRTEDQHVIDRETYWKDVLLSGSLGHNRN